MNGPANRCALRLYWTRSSQQTKRATNGAFTMQTVRCGHRAGISGSFHESLATDRPHMRQQ